MEVETQANIAFFLTGSRSPEHLDTVQELHLRPALFARYRELKSLRYDFPLVLVEGRADSLMVQSLSGMVDAALESTASGGDGERVRKDALRLEQEIRSLVASGAEGPFSALWDKAAGRFAQDADPLFSRSIAQVRNAVKANGALVDCDALLPSRLLQHAWGAVQRRKAQGFRKEIDKLILKLSDILTSAHQHSAGGRSAESLQAAVAGDSGKVFDFDVMSRLLSKALPPQEFSQSRRKRIRELIRALTAQQFIPESDRSLTKNGAVKPYPFLFTSCASALSAFRRRMPKLIELAKAIAIGELEISGQYSEARHDALFAKYGANGLDPEIFDQFPTYLVCLNGAKINAAEQAHLMEILTSGWPIKVLLQIDDILEDSPDGRDNLSAGMRSRQIARMAIGLNEVYVLQSSAAYLLRFREHLLRGLSYAGPALFSVFSGASEKASELTPYLVSAAATESRAFPSFTYDPSAGPNWASRFFLDSNPQVDLDWPIQPFTYEDEEHQRVTQDIAFTMVDFLACDSRFARHLARVPRAKWNSSMIAVDDCLLAERKGLPSQVPCVLMVDAENRLQKVIADEGLIREARRCREMWHSLQELGGVHNSHAERLLAREKIRWEDSVANAAQTPVAAQAEIKSPMPASAPDVTKTEVEEQQEPERSPDEAYIETGRCSSCDECTQINPKMFAYDGNKQAYIADIHAGTFAQLVEAAESCQVSVIHPGKPLSENEPGLDELRVRAESFM